MAQFEGKERRQAKIDVCLKEYGMATLEEAKDFVEEIMSSVTLLFVTECFLDCCAKFELAHY